MDYNYLKGIDGDPQIPTHFPNDNTRHIDYVISYKYEKKMEEDIGPHEDEDDIEKREQYAIKEATRRRFLHRLKQEGFEIKEIKFTINDHVHVYLLLYCHIERLLQEAERTRLEMRLNNTHFEYDDNEYVEVKWISALKNFIMRRKPLKKDPTGNIITTPYESSIRYLFYGCDDKSLKNGDGPFSTSTRCLLVDNILKNLNVDEKVDNHGNRIMHELKHLKFSNNESSNKLGLLYMINEGFFEDSMILHDPTNHYFHLIDMIEYVRKNKGTTKNANITNDTANNATDENTPKENKSDTSDSDSDDDFKNNPRLEMTDHRKDLYNKWAKLTNIFRSQPLYLVRNYFGEAIAFYFAWVGTFIFAIIFPTIVGIALFIYGVVIGATTIPFVFNSTANTTIIQKASFYGNYYLSIFSNAFDNDSTPYYALMISIWGAFFSEFWSRENSRLAFEWDVIKFESYEPDLPEYTRRTKLKKERFIRSSDLMKYFLSHERRIKTFISYCILFVMVCIVCMDIALIALFRIYIKKKAFPNDSVLQIVVGDFGSTIINSIVILILNYIYKIIVVKFTHWENHRTKTEFEDALIYKLFLFEFVNSYGSLFYLAFFRKIYYPNGLFGLGSDYQDTCDGDNCMALLTTQVLVVLLINPLPLFLSDVIWPIISLLLKTIKVRIQSKSIFSRKKRDMSLKEDRLKKLNEKIVFEYITVEKSKPPSDTALVTEYTQKVILYGYLMLFACSFTLAPLILLLINVFDLRVDGLRLLWLFRRPIPYKAQDIGAWFYIVRILNVVGIVSNAFIIAFTSNWSTEVLEDRLDYRLLFVVIFEHVVFIIWLLITYLYSGMPSAVKFKMRIEAKMVREAIDAFKNIKQDMMGMTSLIGSSTSLNRRMNGQSKAALADKTDDDQISIYDNNNNNNNSTTLVNELIKKSVDKLGAVESLGVMIRPNVVVEIDNQIISEPNSSEFDNDPESKGDKRKKKKKASKNAKIMPLNDD